MPVTAPQNPMQMQFMQPNMAGMNGRGVMNVANSNTGPMSQLAMAQQIGGNNPGNPFNGLSYGGNSNYGPNTGIPTYGTVGGSAPRWYFRS